MTGGTIDSYFDGKKDAVVPFEKSVIPDYLDGLNLHFEFNFTEVCMKDSRDMTLEDMDKVAKVIENSKDSLFIVTHGTYTMPDTARFLKMKLNRKDAVVLLTGALVPLEFGRMSDSAFNLGFSIAKIFDLNEGVHVCMNGTIFSPDEIAKMVNKGQFVSIFSEK